MYMSLYLCIVLATTSLQLVQRVSAQNPPTTAPPTAVPATISPTFAVSPTFVPSTVAPSYSVKPSQKPSIRPSPNPTTFNPTYTFAPTSVQQESEANALCAFKQGITNWPGRCQTTTGWNCNGKTATTVPCGAGATSWTGVSCTGSSISLFSRNGCSLKGTISSELSALTGLQQISLSHNILSNSVPSQLSALTNLNYLDLSENLLTSSIPSQISALTGLQGLFLFKNIFSRSIPSELSALTNLNSLDFSNNFLTSSIPTQIFNLLNLAHFLLTDNALTNSIPTQLSKLSLLHSLDLSKNNLNAKIPSQISLLTSLSYLYLEANQLSDIIPIQLFVLTELIALSLSNNRFSNSIPTQISALTNLIYLYLDNNQFTKTIPAAEISMLTGLSYLYLHSNSLTGQIPYQISALTTLSTLYLNSNSLYGSIPHQISALAHLENLNVACNSLSGSIASELSMITSLQYLNISSNRFVGTVPVEFINIHSEMFLQYLDISSNNLHGDPFIFIGFRSIIFVNASHNDFDDFSSFKSANGTTLQTRVLNYLDISSNKFPTSGSLLDNIVTAFPNLLLLSASNNCLLPSIPETLCNLNNLQTLLLNTMGSRCTATNVSTSSNTIFSKQIAGSKHTIPSCLLSLSSIQLLHLIGNYLKGTLSEVISPSLASLSLVGNLLEGSLPKSVQLSFNLTILQLSFNRLSGTLIEDAFQNLPSDSTIELYSNRISGNIPKRLSTFDKNQVDILTGNLFNCYGEAPSNIKDFQTYSCGSSSIGFYQWIYLAVGVVLVLGSVLRSLSLRYKGSLYVKSHLFVNYFHSFTFPADLFDKMNNVSFLVACIVVALITTILNIILKEVEGNSHSREAGGDRSSVSYSTHELQYGWTATFMFVHGILPFVLVLTSLSTLLSVYLYNMKLIRERSSQTSAAAANTTAQSAPKSTNSDDIGLTKIKAADRNDVNLLPFLSISNSKDTWNNFVLKPFSMFVNNAHFRRFLFLQLINVTAVTAVNVLYILVENESDSSSPLFLPNSIKKLVPIALSIFKIIWSNSIIVLTIHYGIKSKLGERIIFHHYAFALIYLYVLVPILTVYFTDVDCYYYSINPIPSITETYYAIAVAYNPVVKVYEQKLNYISQSIVPSWIYSYQCGFSILQNYIPAVLAKYTISGIVLPTLKLLLLNMSPSSQIRNINIPVFNVFKMLMSYTLNAMPDNELLDDVDKRQFRTYRYLCNNMLDVLMLLTFGVLCPFLTFIIVTSIVVNELVNHLQIGSYLHDRKHQSRAENNNINVGLCRFSSCSQNQNQNHLSQGPVSNDSYSEDPTLQMQVIFSAFHSQDVEQDIARQNYDINSNISSINKIDYDDDVGAGVFKQDEEQIKILSSIYLSNAYSLYSSMWKPMIITVLFFTTLIMFDFIADVHTNLSGFGGVLIFWFVILVCFYSRKRFRRLFTCVMTCCNFCFKEETLGN